MLTKCSCCGAEIDSSAYRCPKCGATEEARKKATEGKWMGIVIVLGIIYMIVGNSIGSIREVFHGVKMTPNTWCGYYEKPQVKDEDHSSERSGKIRILSSDINKGGSSICLAGMSWKDSVDIELGKPGDRSYDIYDDQIIILHGYIKDGKLYNVSNVKKW